MISSRNQMMNGARGSRAAMTAATSTVLITPPAKTGIDAKRLAINASRMSGGTSGPASTSHRVIGQRGRL
jgi:hypothetical protein